MFCQLRSQNRLQRRRTRPHKVQYDSAIIALGFDAHGHKRSTSTWYVYLSSSLQLASWRHCVRSYELLMLIAVFFISSMRSTFICEVIIISSYCDLWSFFQDREIVFDVTAAVAIKVLLTGMLVHPNVDPYLLLQLFIVVDFVTWAWRHRRLCTSVSRRFRI